MQDDGRNLTQYFATLPPNQLTKELLYRIETFDKFITSSGRMSAWQKTYNLYNDGMYKGARINMIGEQAEYSEIPVNHFRNILSHILTITTNQRPAFDARASNTDYKSQAQTIIGNGILEYYNRVKGMDNITKVAVEDLLQFADGYVYQGWDFSLGDPVMPDMANPGKVMKQGDVFHKNYTPIDVIFDFTAGLVDAPRQWYILRDFQNKWDLAARYPELKDNILRYALDSKMQNYMRVGYRQNDPSDTIPVFMFFHDRTDSVPDGRIFTFVADDCWMIDTALPSFYKTLPIYRLCASEQRGSGFGYTVAYDLAPIQDAINGLYSTVITNQSTFGVQNITMPKGADINASQLVDGLNLITYDPKLGKPEVLQLLSTPKEIFDFIQMLEHTVETLSGVNSVARGNPEASLKSGSALALVQSMAIQFMSSLQQSYANFLEDLGLGLINILQECATSTRLVEISGKSNRTYMKEFTKKDISSISRVTVDMGNPVSRTTAGKVSMAENLLNSGLIKDPQQYIQVLTTGRLEPEIEGQQAELMLIRAENEAMGEGGQVQAVAIDNHQIHVQEHKCVLASPEVRSDPKIIKNVLAHIQQHIDLWKNSDPSLLQLLGEPLPPQLMLPAPPDPGQEPKPGSNAPPMNPNNPVEAQAAKVKQPNLPKSPLDKNQLHAA